MMRVSAIVSVAILIATCAQAVKSKHNWKPVPNHDGVFVDMASVQHRPATPARDAYHLPGPDTTADIKVDGQIAQGTDFWCARPDIDFGDVTFGEFRPGDPPTGTKLGVIPMKDTRAVVCGAQ